MIRTKNKKNKVPNYPSGLLGGHMPDPPEDCPGKKVRHPIDNRVYIDCVQCFDCPLKKTCQRKKENEQEWKTYRAWLKNEHPTSS